MFKMIVANVWRYYDCRLLPPVWRPFALACLEGRPVATCVLRRLAHAVTIGHGGPSSPRSMKGTIEHTFSGADFKGILVCSPLPVLSPFFSCASLSPSPYLSLLCLFLPFPLLCFPLLRLSLFISSPLPFHLQCLLIPSRFFPCVSFPPSFLSSVTLSLSLPSPLPLALTSLPCLLLLLFPFSSPFHWPLIRLYSSIHFSTENFYVVLKVYPLCLTL